MLLTLHMVDGMGKETQAGQWDPPSMRPPFPVTPVAAVTLPKAPAPTREHPTHSPWCKGRPERAGACSGDTTIFLCPSITTDLMLVLPRLGPTWWILHGAKEMGQFTVSLGWAVPKARKASE